MTSAPPLLPAPAVSENFLIVENSVLESGHLAAMSERMYRYGSVWRRKTCNQQTKPVVEPNMGT
jgi:hypothetical protein